ncbi:MAG TPA: Na-translocating system protein MpsC family protein [Bacillus sp. (in: firmicutes)]|nr:Na-translocating system protein MpsC family protein [Bacillus sp. (in: firmicutes)]
MERSIKKQLATLYNEVSKEIFSTGVHDQKIHIVEDKILILARTKRIPALDALSDEHSELVLSLDSALSARYKKLLKEKLQLALDMKITSVFRDYDPAQGTACTVICFENLIAE